MKDKDYDDELYELQIELVKFQKHVIKKDLKVCLVFEGRDAAGKDGTIKRFMEHLSPREAKVVALDKPSDKEIKSWYFQRYVQYLPSGGQIIFFNRSWYNRAGVERVMGFCTKKEYTLFMEEVGNFENLLIHSGIILLKYYLDISEDEQKERLESRRKDPLKQWKLSPVDQHAQKYWKEYSNARDEMFEKTSFVLAPWFVAHSDNKKTARINVMKHFLSRMDYPDKDEKYLDFDHNIICKYEPECHTKGWIAK